MQPQPAHLVLSIAITMGAITIMVTNSGRDKEKLHRKKARARNLATSLLKPPASARS